jgi:hypothetical protein|nr:protein kinase [Kofleriaceae bacterium]
MGSVHDRRVGDVLDGRFEILGFAGAGGMGAVYRALDRTTGRVVALKVVDPAAEMGREAELLASIDHPGVVRCFDYGVARDGARFVVMEWITGVDLEAWLAHGRAEVGQVLELARQVATALAAIHARGVVHRDVKPANLLLVERDGADGGGIDDRVDAVKLVDFGIAGELADLERSEPGLVIGTPEYMAPEALRGDTVDARADVYSLGAVMFRALAGRPVFTGANRIAVLAKVLLEVPPAICELRPDVPLEVEELLARMLAKDPARRPADGAEVVRVLGELAAVGAGEQVRRGRPAVTAGEQRLSCLVLCAGRGRAGATMPLARLRREDVDVERAAARAGGVLEGLPSGGLLVHVDRGTPAERAARAASCALAIAAVRPGTPVVVATGQVVTAGGAIIDAPSTPRGAGGSGRAAAPGVAATGATTRREAGAIDRAAAELASIAPGVWIDETTASLLDERFEVAEDDGGDGGAGGDGGGPRGELSATASASGGWRAAPRWWRLVAERDAIAPVRLFMGKRAPCVGRAAELAALAAVLDDAFESPRARTVIVSGPPGLGKSRLVHELLATPRARDAAALGARGDAARAGSPFALASSLLASAARLAPGDDAAARRAKLRARIARDGAGDPDRIADVLGDIVGGVHAAAGDAAAAVDARAADPTVLTDAIRAAWCDWLAAAARRPLVIVVEDVQWGDLPSLRLFDAALAALAAQPVLAIATARPEVRTAFPDLFAARDPWELRLGRLAGRAAEELVRAALPAADTSTVAELVARAGGHPFHLEELVRAIAAGAGPTALPATVLGMVQARLDVLDRDARRVLRAASVFGEAFEADGAAALVGDAVPGDQLARCLDALCEQEIVARGPQGFAFRHALVREAVYATLPDADRAVAHRAAGLWLESTGCTDAAVVGDHFDRGGAPQRALRQLRRAAEQALDGEDQLRAAALVERALRCGADDLERGHLRAIEAEVALWRGDFDHAAEHALAAADALEPGTAPWFSTLAHAITAFGQRGHNDRVAEQLDRVAAAHLRDGHDHAATAVTPDVVRSAIDAARGACATALCRGLAQLYWAHYRGDVTRPQRRVEALADQALAPYHAGWVQRVRAESAWLHAHDADRTLATYDASIEAFTAARALRPLCLTRLNAASLAAWSGATARGQRLVDDGLADARRLGSGFLATYGTTVAAVLAAYAGRPEAMAALRAALPAMTGSPRLAFLLHVYVGWLADADGDRAAAAEAALALPVVPELHNAALALQSTALRRRGDVAGAVAVAREAVAIAASGDLELTDGFAGLALAEALDAAGDRAGARAALAAAVARLDAIAATIADPAQRAAFRHRPLPNAQLVELSRRWA